MEIALIGAGQMGRGMAERLLAKGHSLVVWNRTPAAAEPLRERGAKLAKRSDDVLASEVVITMLADDTAFEGVWIDAALTEKLRPETIHLNMASVSLRMASRLAALHRECGRQYVAAPVFGRPQAAAAGELDIIAAGAREALARCVPLFEVLGRKWFDLGADPAHANVVKIARNFLLGTIIESLGEAFALVGKSGVDRSKFLEIITSTSMSAPAYTSYGRRIIEPPSEVTFTLELGLKDVELALQAAAQLGVPLPTGALMREQHRAAIARGYGDKDWAALGNYIAEAAR